MPTKNRDKYSRIKPAIEFYSKKNRVQMFCESRTEVGALYELEFDPTVRRYQTQPDTFSYRRNGAKRRYTPDVLCEGIDGSFWFEEIKSWRGANRPNFQAKHLFLTELFDDVLHVPLKLRISTAPYNCNWRGNLAFLYRYLGHAFNDADYTALITVRRPTPIADVIAKAHDAKLSLNTVYAGLAQRLLTFDESQKISPWTSVWGANNV